MQDRVARVLRRLGVRAHLSQDVVHLLTGLRVVLAKYAQQTQYSHLKKCVTDATHVVIGTVARQEQVLQDAHKIWHQLNERIKLNHRLIEEEKNHNERSKERKQAVNKQIKR